MESLELRLFCTALPLEEYERLRRFDRQAPGLCDIAAVHRAIKEVVQERLGLAERLLLFTDGFYSGAAAAGALDDMTARVIASRGYYAIHHAIRALVQYATFGDPFTHEGALNAVFDLVSRESELAARVGDVRAFRRRLSEAIKRRHLADYAALGTTDAAMSPRDFVAEASEVVTFAREVFDLTRGYIADKEAGII